MSLGVGLNPGRGLYRETQRKSVKGEHCRMTSRHLDHCLLILRLISTIFKCSNWDSDWHRLRWIDHDVNMRHCKEARGQNCELLLLYLQIPEGVILCPCISFSLPSTVYLGAHFHATSAKKPTDVNREVRHRLQQGISSTSVSKKKKNELMPCLMWRV